MKKENNKQTNKKSSWHILEGILGWYFQFYNFIFNYGRQNKKRAKKSPLTSVH